MNMEQFKLQAMQHGVGKLAAKTGLSRSHIYGILNGVTDPSLSTLQKLMDAIGYQLKLEKKSQKIRHTNSLLKNENFIIWNLALHGAPLLVHEQFNQPLDINEVLIRAIELGRKNSQINAILPYFIYRNWNIYNKSLKRIIKKIKDKRYFAYLLNLIFHFTNDLEISDRLNDLRRTIRVGFLPQRLIQRGRVSKFEKQRLKSVDNMIASSWKLQTLDSLTDAEVRFRKWNEGTT